MSTSITQHMCSYLTDGCEELPRWQLESVQSSARMRVCDAHLPMAIRKFGSPAIVTSFNPDNITA